MDKTEATNILRQHRDYIRGSEYNDHSTEIIAKAINVMIDEQDEVGDQSNKRPMHVCKKEFKIQKGNHGKYTGIEFVTILEQKIIRGRLWILHDATNKPFTYINGYTISDYITGVAAINDQYKKVAWQKLKDRIMPLSDDAYKNLFVKYMQINAL